MGYSEESKADHLWKRGTRNIIKARDVKIIEPETNIVNVGKTEDSETEINDGIDHLFNFGDHVKYKTENQHNRSKHIDIRYHFIRDVIKKKEVCVQYQSTTETIADILIKNLGRQKHELYTRSLGIINLK